MSGANCAQLRAWRGGRGRCALRSSGPGWRGSSPRSSCPTRVSATSPSTRRATGSEAPGARTPIRASRATCRPISTRTRSRCGPNGVAASRPARRSRPTSNGLPSSTASSLGSASETRSPAVNSWKAAGRSPRLPVTGTRSTWSSPRPASFIIRSTPRSKASRASRARSFTAPAGTTPRARRGAPRHHRYRIHGRADHLRRRRPGRAALPLPAHRAVDHAAGESDVYDRGARRPSERSRRPERGSAADEGHVRPLRTRRGGCGLRRLEVHRAALPAEPRGERARPRPARASPAPATGRRASVS